MGFREAVTVCFQDYYKFSGRARRPEYWWFVLFLVIVSLILSGIDEVIFGADKLLGLDGLFTLLTFLPSLAVSWRRLHDTGRPGWYNLLPYISIIPLIAIYRMSPNPEMDTIGLLTGLAAVLLLSSIIVIIWLVFPSQSGENRFGPEPPA